MPADSTFAFQACAPLVVLNSFAKSVDDGLDLNVRLAFTSASLRRALAACGALDSIRVHRHVRRTLERLPMQVLPSVRNVYIAPHRDVRLCDVAPALEVGVNVFVDSVRFDASHVFVPTVCTARVHVSRVCIELDVSEGRSRVMVDVLADLFERGVLSTRNFELRIRNVYEYEVWTPEGIVTPEALVPIFTTKDLDTVVVNDHRIRWFERGGTMKTLVIGVVDGTYMRRCIENIDSLQMFPRLENLVFKNHSGLDLCMKASDVLWGHSNLKRLEFHEFSFQMGQGNNGLIYFLIVNGVEDVYFHDPAHDEETDVSFDEWAIWFFGTFYLVMQNLKSVRLYTSQNDTIDIRALRMFFRRIHVDFWLE